MGSLEKTEQIVGLALMPGTSTPHSQSMSFLLQWGCDSAVETIQREGPIGNRAQQLPREILP